MYPTGKISSFQFYTVLFLGRIFTLVTFLSNIKTDLAASDFVCAAVLMGLFLAITSLPTYFLIKADSASSVLSRASCVSARFEKLLCVVYFAVLSFYSAMTAARFDLLASSVMFPETDMTFAVILLLAAAVYCAYRGIASLGRSCVIFLVPVALAFAFVFLTTAKRFDTLNFDPLSGDMLAQAIPTGALFAGRTGEIVLLPLLTEFVDNHKKNGVFVYVACVTALIFATFAMMAGVLGSFGSKQLFSMYSLSVIAEFGFVSRLDAIITCIWMLCACVKLSVSLFACGIILKRLFFGGKIEKSVKLGENAKRLVFLTLSAAVAFAAMMFFSRDIERFSSIAASPAAVIVYAVGAIAAPVSVLLAEKIKNVKNGKNTPKRSARKAQTA